MRRRRGVVATVAVSLAVGVGLPAAFATLGDVKPFTVHPQPWGIVTGPDGKVWYTSEAPTTTDTGYGWISADGKTTGFHKNLVSAYPVDIVAGPDGRLWINGWNPNKINRVTTAGVATAFDAKTTSSQINSLTVGPDDHIWFTLFDADKIGRMSLDGQTVKEYSLAAGAGPDGITTGPDGHLWFTEQSGNKIGTMKPDGTGYHEYGTDLSPSAFLQYITAGPDGNLWFAECNTDTIGRITTAGVITEFNTNITAGSCPEGIAPGWDHNLWFSESGATTVAVGRITPSGTVNEYGSTKYAGAVAPGIDGNVWLTDWGTGAVDRVDDTDQVGVAYDLVRDNFFTPVNRRATLGGQVEWMFLGPNAHGVRDSSGMGLFNSGPKSIVSYYMHRFHAAGTYPYHSPGDTGMTGSVAVPMAATPKTGTTSTAFALTWADGAAPAGFEYDVEIKRPGDAHFQAFRTGVTFGHGSYTPTKGAGKYSFRARLRRKSDGTHTGWSPVSTVTAT
jgi:virginiamycin B lyase